MPPRPVRPPTQADVARRAGVTATTVSLSLRNDPRITAETQRRVRAAAAELAYKPDPVLSALVARRDSARPRRSAANIAVLVDDRWPLGTQMLWLDSMVSGLRTASLRLGYDLDLIHLRRDLGPHRQPDHLLYSRGIRGVVLLPLQNYDLVPPLDWSRYATVAIGNPPDSLPLHRVGSDAFTAAHVACERLRALGYRRLGLVNPRLAEQRLRFEWLGGIAKEHFLPGSVMEIVPPHLPETLEARGLLAWLRREAPEVVVTNEGRVFQWLKEAGIAPPKDIGLVLLNRDALESENISGFRQNLDASGEAAIDLLHSLLLRGETGFPAIPREVLIRPHWIDGDTLRRLSP